MKAKEYYCCLAHFFEWLQTENGFASYTKKVLVAVLNGAARTFFVLSTKSVLVFEAAQPQFLTVYVQFKRI